MLSAFRPARRTAVALALVSATTGCLFGGKKKPKPPAPPPPEPTVPVAANMARDVAFLASDQMEGRRTGSPGFDSAASYVRARFESYKFPSVTLQPFVARSVIDEHAGRPSQLQTNNVIAILPGSDPKLRGQYVVLGAHLDHLGRISEGSLDPDLPNAIRNGADDNASGVAAIMELARLFRLHPTKRSLAFLAFSGEELGLLGSQYFAEHAPFSLDSVEAMLNFDMVGRLREDKLLIFGAETAREFRTIIDSANAVAPLQVAASGDGFGASDQTSFYTKDIPVLHFFTNVHDDYHRSSDDPEKINAAGMARVVALAERITRNLADRPNRITFVRVAVANNTTTSGRPGEAYLGTIPDMGATGIEGLRVSGVRAGSPADRAGMLAGDIVVDFDGTAVTNLQSYSNALNAKKPGDTVTITVMRRGKRTELKATLTKRGG
jgi:aminopeptidase YwaD